MHRHRRARIVLVSALVLALTGLWAAPAAASAQPPPVTGKSCPAGQGCTPPLAYKGGPVQHHPRVYLIFWGPKWLTDTTGAMASVIGVINGAANTALNNVLSQYTDDSGDYVHNDVYLAGSWLLSDASKAPPSLINGTNGPGLVAAALAANPSWTNTPDTQFVLVPQEGTYAVALLNAPSCGYHVYKSGYVIDFVDYPTSGTPCSGDATSIMTQTTFHEYAEAATDPQYDGITGAGASWQTNDSMPQEIGDLCFDGSNSGPDVLWPHLDSVSPRQSSVGNVQALWSNVANGCTYAYGEDGFVPSPQTIYTVQQPMQVDYDAYAWATGTPQIAPVGYPTGPQTAIPGGLKQTFSSGAMYYSTTTYAHEVQGAIYSRYKALGEAGDFGFPTSDEQAAPGGGRENTFNGSSCGGSGAVILWTSATGAWEMHGCIYNDYLHKSGFGGPVGQFGYPVSNEQETSSNDGRVNYTDGSKCSSGQAEPHSALYFNGATWGVKGCIFVKYRTMGETSSGLGYPTSLEFSTSAGIRQNFQYGYMLWANGVATPYITGSGTCTDYGGSTITGPNACVGFYTAAPSGQPASGNVWFSGGGVGLHGQEIWTYASGTTATSTADYSLSGFGTTYATQLQAYIPNNHSDAIKAHYHFCSPGGGCADAHVDQSNVTNNWTNIGIVCTTDGTATVTLSDDGGDAYPLEIGADAIRGIATTIPCSP